MNICVLAPFLLCIASKMLCLKISEKPERGQVLGLGLLRNLSIEIHGNRCFPLHHFGLQKVSKKRYFGKGRGLYDFTYVLTD